MSSRMFPDDFDWASFITLFTPLLSGVRADPSLNVLTGGSFSHSERKTPLFSRADPILYIMQSNFRTWDLLLSQHIHLIQHLVNTDWTHPSDVDKYYVCSRYVVKQQYCFLFVLTDGKLENVPLFLFFPRNSGLLLWPA